MAIHIVFRSYGGENRKNRPAYYSKTMALASCIRAAERAGASLHFFNDGPVPADRLALMGSSGPVTTSATPEGMRATYWGALRWAASQPWPNEDVVWFSEDDYAYDPEAFTRLAEVEEARRDLDYFALYGSIGESEHAVIPDDQLPRGWRPYSVRNGDTDWHRVDSVASTFGARLGALRQDLGIFRFCMLPHRRSYRDHDTCLVYQGYEPYRWGYLLRALVGASIEGADGRARLRRMGIAPFQVLTNLRSHRRPSRRRKLMAASPNLSAHLENALIPSGRDWERIAEETMEWLTRRTRRGSVSASQTGSTPEPAAVLPEPGARPRGPVT